MTTPDAEGQAGLMLALAQLLLMPACAAFVLTTQPTLGPTPCRAPSPVAGLFDMFKETEAQKAAKEAEWKAQQEMVARRRNPEKMAEYNAEVNARRAAATGKVHVCPLRHLPICTPRQSHHFTCLPRMLSSKSCRKRATLTSGIGCARRERSRHPMTWSGRRASDHGVVKDWLLIVLTRSYLLSTVAMWTSPSLTSWARLGSCLVAMTRRSKHRDKKAGMAERAATARAESFLDSWMAIYRIQ